MTRVSVFLAWYDLWIGAYYDRGAKTLYVCLLPCVVIKILLARRVRWKDLIGAFPDFPDEEKEDNL
jgi:hypothetical protein